MWLNRLGETQIAQRVLMRAIDQCVVGDAGQAGERLEHLLGRAFEKASTTGCEQRVATEQPWLVWVSVKVGDVSERVPWDGDDLQALAEHLDPLAVAQRLVTRGDLLGGWPVDAGAGLCLEPLDATDMVVMVVRHQNVAQLPAGMCRQPVQHGRCVTGIDRHATPGSVVLEQPDIVVGEGGQGFDLEHGWVAKRITKAHPRGCSRQAATRAGNGSGLWQSHGSVEPDRTQRPANPRANGAER